MSPLPRPVKQLLAPPDEAPVARAWVRLERTRRAPRPVRPVVVWASLGAVVAVGLVAWLGLSTRGDAAVPSAVAARVDTRPPASPAPMVAPPTREGAHAAPPSRPAPHVWWHGRPTPGVPRPSLMQGPTPAADAPVDVAGALLASADDAWRAGQTTRAATLLSELAAHHPDDARAGVALYLLGQMQLDVLAQPQQAVVSLQRALQLGVPDDVVGPLWTALERAQREADALAAP